MPQARVALAGSGRTPLPNAKIVSAVDPSENVQVTVVLRRRPTSNFPAKVEDFTSTFAERNTHMTRADFAAAHGADPDDLMKIEDFAHEYGLATVEMSASRRSVTLSGTASDMEKAFGTKLSHYEHPQGRYRGRTGEVTLPQDIHSRVQAVLGLDNRPVAKPHVIRHDKSAPAAATALTPLQVGQLYNFPTNGKGSGQTIAIIELGGGYRSSELRTYFNSLGIHTPPKVTAVSVDGGHNRPGVDQNADGEVMLDIEVAGAVAPGCKIAVYFAPNTDQGFHDAISMAAHDMLRRPSVISISWGAPETGPANQAWTPQAMQVMNAALQDAAAMGITVTVASGDNGSDDGVGDGGRHVDFPSSSPFVLACGGTHLESSGGKITLERVWNNGPNSATGGGVSQVFQLPAYQKSAKVPPSPNTSLGAGRGVPDIGGDADPQTGYRVLVDGSPEVIGGTSAVAPLWAGLIALLNQQLGKTLGFVNPALYALSGSGAFQDITSGNNGDYSANKGWDACTGLGTPNGAALLHALSGASAKAATT